MGYRWPGIVRFEPLDSFSEWTYLASEAWINDRTKSITANNNRFNTRYTKEYGQAVRAQYQELRVMANFSAYMDCLVE